MGKKSTQLALRKELIATAAIIHGPEQAGFAIFALLRCFMRYSAVLLQTLLRTFPQGPGIIRGFAGRKKGGAIILKKDSFSVFMSLLPGKNDLKNNDCPFNQSMIKRY
jgi:hypothetical protein